MLKWFIVGAALVGLGAGAVSAASYLMDPGSEPMSLDSDWDACPWGLWMSSEWRPAREPDHVASFDVREGERFTIRKAPGIWRGLLASDDAQFVQAPPGGVSQLPWTGVLHMGWCHSQVKPDDFLARGDGRVTLSVWQGQDDGFGQRRLD